MNRTQINEIKETLAAASTQELAEIVVGIANTMIEAARAQEHEAGEPQEAKKFKRVEAHLINAAWELIRL